MSEIIKGNYIQIKDLDQFQELVNHLDEVKAVAYDIESTSLNPRKGKIIGVSVSTAPGNGWYLPIYKYKKETDELKLLYYESARFDRAISAIEVAKVLVSKLKGKKLIMHNGSFDCRFTKCFLDVDLIEDLWVDTMLLVHTVQEGGTGPMGGFALKDIAVAVQDKIGIDATKQANEEQVRLKESIVANGGTTTKTNYEIWKADIEILAEYAAADTDLTFRICKYFLGRLKEEGLEQFYFIDEVMPIYREVTIPMELDGIKLDLDLLHENDEKIKLDIEKYRKDVIDQLTSDKRFKSWLFDKITTAYPPTPKGRFAQELLKSYGLDIPLRKKELSKLPDDCEIKSFLITGEIPKDFDSKKLLKISLDLWKEDYDGHLINIQSKQQLGSIVFGYFKEKPLSSTKKGSPQFDDDILEVLVEKYPWARSLQIYNKLIKIKSTYIDRFLEESEEGRFYPYFKQHGTVSGRYGSNLQQLPKPLEEEQHDPIVIYYTNLIRRFFISDEDWVFIDNDYQSLEPHIFASITDDKNLQEIFDKGLDFYSYVAIKTKNLEQYSADKKADNYLGKLAKVERQEAKPYALGMAYGMSPYALAMTLGIKPGQGEKLHKGYLQGFPGVARWIESSREHVQKEGKISTIFGRIRHLPEVKELFEIFGNSLMDWRKRKLYEREFGLAETTKMYQAYRNGMNSLLNFQIQSPAASIVNRAALQINRYLKENSIPGKVVAQIHDQLLTMVPKEFAEQVAVEVQRIMETTVTLPGVTLKAKPEISTNFYDGH